MRLSRWIGFGLCACSTLACAGDSSDRPPGLDYAEHAPAEFPRKDATLSETLDSIVAPRTTNAMVTSRDIRVLRIDVDPWQEIPSKEVKSGRYGPPPNARYAIVASLYCNAHVDRERIYGEKLSWYLLPGGRLVAWDHHNFGDACTMADEFEPARGDQIADEKHLIEYVQKSFPPSVVHVDELYYKGLAYARVGRLDDAQAMLAAGDRGFDFTADEKLDTNEGYDQRFTGDRRKMRGLRAQLVRELQKARGSQGAAASP
jgi:hypothetical protein